MNTRWELQFRERMRSFEQQRPPREGETSVSLKVRVVSGCFHREHSPSAYQLIDDHLASIPVSERSDIAYVEHESGPELLVYLALATSGVTLAKSAIDLIVAILKARTEGVKNGDRPNAPVEVIIRRVGDKDRFLEETILRIDQNDAIKRGDIEALINAALKRTAGNDTPPNSSS